MPEFDLLMIDDHALIIEGVRSQLANNRSDIIFHSASTLADASRKLTKLSPSFLVLDLALPDGDGIDFFSRVRQSSPEVAGILLSGTIGDADVQRALSAGFQALLTKSGEHDDILTALMHVQSGEQFWAPEVAPIAENFQDQELFSPRMIEVLFIA